MAVIPAAAGRSGWASHPGATSRTYLLPAVAFPVGPAAYASDNPQITFCAGRGNAVGYGLNRQSAEVMRILFLENEDSFTWNVIDALPFERRDVCIRSGRDAAEDRGALDGFGAVVIGPGPTDPERAGIVNIVRAAAQAQMPLLGICLGHQALGLAFGAGLIRTHPTHGKTSIITFEPSRFFPGFHGPQTVMRYHSLSLAAVATPLRVIAWTADRIPMAIEHESLPLAGLQFHPDSYGTPRGREMIAEFFKAVG